MILLHLLERSLATAGAVVRCYPVGTPVLAEQSMGLIDIVDHVLGGLDMHRPYRAIAKTIQKTVLRKVVFDGVIFSAISSTRGARAGTRPFVEFLQAAGFTTPFLYTTAEQVFPAYRTANWQFILVYGNHLGVGNIGRVSLIELDVRRKTPGVTVRTIRALLSQYAENVPNERGVTRAGKAAGKPLPAAAPLETKEPIPESAVEAQPLDTEHLRGQRFQSFQDLARHLL